MSERVSSLARLFAVEPENDWRPKAACQGLDPELFFSSDDIVNRQERLEREAEAKAVCTRCTVRSECLTYALDAGERYGVWGGMTAQERRALGRSRAGNAAAERVS
ncbi:MAG TPA: WhiB family transcriptional regulator [Actinomycetota bacterium]|jgi:WhiB family redox-sensing transcriptional regulator|nr:WhiB family transcriptional regulator [Actinomycetota bacterium]